MVQAPVKELTVYYEDIVGLKIQDRYELVHFVKAGGSSGVFAAYDRKMDRRVAVKLLPPTDPMMAARFEREAMTLSKLHHPNTLTVFDFGRTPDNYLYMVMELLEGETLKDVMRRDQWFAPRRAVHIVAQICRSLWNAHQHGVVHRDIKPSNIFLVDCDGDSEFVKVLDFGVAKLLHVADNPVDDGTQVGRIIGTPRYMAPEQISSEPVDARADMYSTGILLYEMVCGVTPFQESSLGPLLMLHLNEPPPRFDSHNIPNRHLISEELEHAVMRSLAKDPRDRFMTIDEMRVALEAAVGGMSRISMDGARLSARLGAAANERTWAINPAPPPLPDESEITGNRSFPTILGARGRTGADDDVEEALVLDDHAPDDDENRSTSISIPLDIASTMKLATDARILPEPSAETIAPLTKTQAVPRAKVVSQAVATSDGDTNEDAPRKANRWLWAAAFALLVGAGGAYFFLSTQESTSPAVHSGNSDVAANMPGSKTDSTLPSAVTGKLSRGESDTAPQGALAIQAHAPADRIPTQLENAKSDVVAAPVEWSVRIISEPNGANVYRGIQRIGTTPFDATVTESMWAQQLRFERPEYITFEASVPEDVQQSAKSGGKGEWVVTLEPVQIPPPVQEKTAKSEPAADVAVSKPRDKKMGGSDASTIKPSRAMQKSNSGSGSEKSQPGTLRGSSTPSDGSPKDHAERPVQPEPKSPDVRVISTVEKPVSTEKSVGSMGGAPNVQIIDDSVKPSAPKLPPAPKDPPPQKPNVPIIQ